MSTGVYIAQEISHDSSSIAQICCQSDRGNAMFLELEDLPLNTAPGAILNVESFRVYFTQFYRHVEVVLSRCAHHYYISVLLEGASSADTDTAATPTFNTRILCSVDELYAPLQLKVVDGPFILAEHPHELRLYPLTAGPGESFPGRPFLILPLPRATIHPPSATSRRGEEEEDSPPQPSPSACPPAVDTAAMPSPAKHVVRLASAHCCHLFDRNLCLLRFSIAPAAPFPDTGGGRGPGPGPRGAVCGWSWLALDLSGAAVKCDLSPSVKGGRGLDSGSCSHGGGGDSWRCCRELWRSLDACSEAGLVAEVPLLREARAAGGGESYQSVCRGVSLVHYMSDPGAGVGAVGAGRGTCSVLLADMTSGVLTSAQCVLQTALPGSDQGFQVMCSAVKTVFLFAPLSSLLPCAHVSHGSGEDSSSEAAKDCVWSVWANSVDVALFCSNFGTSGGGSGVKSSEGRVVQSSRGGAAAPGGSDGGVMLVVGVTHALTQLAPDRRDVHCMEEESQGTEEACSLGQETAGGEGGGGSVQLLRATTLDVLQVFEGVGGFALTSHWGRGGYQLVLLAPAVVTKHRIFQLFPFGHVFTEIPLTRQPPRSIGRDDGGSGGGSATAGSDQWCVLEVSGLDTRGVRRVFTTAGDCGSLGQWRDTGHEEIPAVTSLSHFLACAAAHRSATRKLARKEEKKRKRGSRKFQREMTITVDSAGVSIESSQQNKKTRTDKGESQRVEGGASNRAGDTAHGAPAASRAVQGMSSEREAATGSAVSASVSPLPLLNMLLALQSRLLISHSEIVDLVGQLDTKSHALRSLHRLLHKWSTSLQPAPSPGQFSRWSSKNALWTMPQPQRRSLRQSLLLPPAGVTAAGAVYVCGRGLAPLFAPPCDEQSAPSAAGISSTRPVESAAWWGAGRRSKLSVVNFSNDVSGKDVRDSVSTASSLSTGPAVPSIRHSSSAHDINAREITTGHGESPLLAQGSSAQPPALSPREVGDCNVGVLGCVAQVVPGTEGREVRVLLAVQNKKSAGAIQGLAVRAAWQRTLPREGRDGSRSAQPETSVLSTSGLVPYLAPGEVCLLSAHLELRSLTSPHIRGGGGAREWGEDVEQLLLLAGAGLTGDLDGTALALSLSTLLDISVAYQLSPACNKDMQHDRVVLSEAIGGRRGVHRPECDLYTRYEESFDMLHPSRLPCSSGDADTDAGDGGDDSGDDSGDGAETERGRGRCTVSVGAVLVPPLGVMPLAASRHASTKSTESRADMSAEEEEEEEGRSWHEQAAILLQPLHLVRCFAGGGFWECLQALVVRCVSSSTSTAGVVLHSYLSEMSFQLTGGATASATSMGMLHGLRIPLLDTSGTPEIVRGVGNCSDTAATAGRDVGADAGAGAEDREAAAAMEVLRAQFIEFTHRDCSHRHCRSYQHGHCHCSSPCVAHVCTAAEQVSRPGVVLGGIADDSDGGSDGESDGGMDLDDNEESGDANNQTVAGVAAGGAAGGSAACVVVGTMYSRHEEDVRAALRGLQYRVALHARAKFMPHAVTLQVRHDRCYQQTMQHCALAGKFLASCLLDELKFVALSWRLMNLQTVGAGAERAPRNGGLVEACVERRTTIQLGPFVQMPMMHMSNSNSNSSSSNSRKPSEGGKEMAISRVLCSQRTDMAMALFLLAQSRL